MEKNNDKRTDQAKKEEQPGNLSSFNNRDVERSTETEKAEKETKKENEVNKDYDANLDERAGSKQ